MSSKSALRVFTLLFAILPLVTFFNNCGQQQAQVDQSSSVEQASPVGCDSSSIPIYMKAPANIEQVTALINALPKPLTIDCFISSLQRPLQIFAVNNTFSAQPAAGVDSPRIFIIFSSMSLSVVPAGSGASKLEVGEFVTSTTSVKAEYHFPILQNVASATPYNNIIDTSFLAVNGATSCRTCHSGEVANMTITTGTAFTSNIVKPDPSKRVLQSYLLYQSNICNSSNSSQDRCRMLKAIFQDGQAEDAKDFLPF